jgi:hypothetical protein
MAEYSHIWKVFSVFSFGNQIVGEVAPRAQILGGGRGWGEILAKFFFANETKGF